MLFRGIIFLALGVLLTYSGLAGEQVTPFSLVISVVILAAIPLLRWLGVSDRLAFTVPAMVLLTVIRDTKSQPSWRRWTTPSHGWPSESSLP